MYTDGSLLKRSGFQRTGAAVVGYCNQKEVFHLQLGLGGHAEISDAELAGLMLAAKRASSYTRTHPEIQNIHIFTDCSSALTTIHQSKPTAGQQYSTSFCHSINQLLASDPNIKATLSWCPSHSGIPGNDRADKLAKEATERALESPIGVTRTNALRRVKMSATKLWNHEWRKTSLTGRYAIANRLPPSLKPTHHFRTLKAKRELFGRTLQCRTGHNHTGEFRRGFSLDGQYACPCGEPTETREHILCHCPRYEAFRHRLQKASHQLFLPTILGSQKGISALSDFIQASGAFTRPNAPIVTATPTYDMEPTPSLEDDSRSEPGD
jgi:ribonuclease HI